jgi:hypothetical protein
MAARSHSPKRMLVGFDARESDAIPVLGMADMTEPNAVKVAFL